MTSAPDREPVAQEAGRHKRTAVAVVIATLMLAGTVLVVQQTTASALPPRCPEGGPPPCGGPPEPTTTPGSTVPRPIVWTTKLSILNQSGKDFNHTVWGSWSRAGSPVYATPSGSAVWTNDTKDEGNIGLTQKSLMAGSKVSFMVRSLGDNGPICRSLPTTAIPASGRSTHILLAGQILKPAADLQALAGGFSGRVTPDPDGAEVTINSVSMVALDTGLQITVKGKMYKDVQFPAPNFDGTFAYVVLVTLHPSLRIDDTSEVMKGYADEGILQLNGRDWTDKLELAWADNQEPAFRKAVVDKVTAAVNFNVASDPQVGWFSQLGYTVSVREVTIDHTGIKILPALCKVA